ncbi:MAG TPA: type II secretion system protein [Verrucomicrobiae bacterium]|nr:type II secretion system protein [Verrucomicrobiae bacterium]
MKMLLAKAKISGLTLIEVLVILAVVFILAALLLPAIHNRPRKATMPMCMNNQKQIAIGLFMFNGDHNGNFPWQLSETNGGARGKISTGRASEQFHPLWDYTKNFSVFICPIDKVKFVATNISTFSESNLSYFVNVDATTNNAANTILTGDRYLMANSKPVSSGLFGYSTNEVLSWSNDSHYGSSNPSGVLSFADDHVEFVRSANLNSIFLRESVITNQFVVP